MGRKQTKEKVIRLTRLSCGGLFTVHPMRTTDQAKPTPACLWLRFSNPGTFSLEKGLRTGQRHLPCLNSGTRVPPKKSQPHMLYKWPHSLSEN